MKRRLIGEVAIAIFAVGSCVASIIWVYTNRLHAAKATAAATITEPRCNLAVTHCIPSPTRIDIHWWTSVLLPTVGFALGILLLGFAVFGIKDIWREQKLEAEASRG